MGRRPGVAKKNQVSQVIDLSLKDQPGCEDPASKGNNVGNQVTKVSANITPIENNALENVSSPRRSRRIQHVGPSSQDQAIETLAETVEVGEKEENLQSIDQEKNGPEATHAGSMEEKVNNLFSLVEEQKKIIESLVSKNPCGNGTNYKLEMKVSKYKNMYVASQKKIEELQDENFELTTKLECANAKLEGYEKGQHVFSAALDKFKDMAFLSNLSKTTETVLGLSSPPHANTRQTSPEPNTAKRKKYDKDARG